MKKLTAKNAILACAAALIFISSPAARAAGTTFDDFNSNEGHFNLAPNYSGSTAGILAASTADRVTADPREGLGCEQLVLITNNAATPVVRFLSGSGTPANNIGFTTSADLTNDWIGCYLKTTNSGWNVRLWIEQSTSGHNNAGIAKDLPPDGQWHLYEWNLANTAGDTNGWDNIFGIAGDGATVQPGVHSIDSIVLRNPNLVDTTNVIFLDFVARNTNGSVAELITDPCLKTPGVSINGPISTTLTQVSVVGVTNTATKVTVYQDSGAGMVVIGAKANGITDGTNLVTVSNLVKTAKVVATQTVSGQESCMPPSGVIVGGGNSRLRVVYSIRETTSAGPIGEPAGDMSSANIHFLGATNVLSGYAPGSGPVIYPSNNWQTLTLKRGAETIADASNVAGTPVASPAYSANDSVSIQVYAFRTLHEVRIYSATPAESTAVTSGNPFAVNWSWTAVPGAEGYRVIRNVNTYGYLEAVDVPGNNFVDANSAWGTDLTVTPTTTQTDPSVQWYWSAIPTDPTVLPGDWGVLESIGIAIEDLTDTGPYDLYIDNLQNGATVFQTFEDAVGGTTDYGFRPPTFSGTTEGGLLVPPNIGEVSSAAADAGTKSFHVQFQFKGTNAASWLRLTTYFSQSGTPMPGGNPMVNLNEPISMRVLLLPAGSTPVPPPPPMLTVKRFGPDVVLDWTDAHNLQTAVELGGTYTNIPGVIRGPHTNSFAEPQRFFRLAN